jgi:nucleoside-diphosphate-sugar epimerase
MAVAGSCQANFSAAAERAGLMHVLVTGANGFVGSHLVEGLLERNHRVRGLVRRTSDLRWLEGLGLDLAFGEVTDPATLPAAVRDIEAVYHAAGATKARRTETYRRVNCQGTVNLLEACREHAPRLKKFVLVSSQAAAGPGEDGRPSREDDPCRPISEYGRSKLMAEEAAAHFMDRLPVTVVRPPAIYGPRDVDFLIYFRILKKHLRPLLGFRQRPVSICHVRDVVSGTILAGKSERSAGRTYFLSGGETTWDELTRTMAEALNVRTLKIRVPVFALHALAALNEVFAPLRREAPVLDRRKAREMTAACWTCDRSRAAEELGYRPSVPLEEGIRETVAWYREMGWI